MKIIEYYDVVEYPVITEKAVDLISTANRLTFVVNKKSTKAQIKDAVEKMYNVKVKTINTLLDRKNRKKAFVTLSKENNAQDVANKLGIL
ncbi:MAG: 50S ribosomal protein L23 [Candidatus ainarchaeum sp.]|nr:50S ribosomal protein L23 [Candidatus ainarchaeum sp.]